MKQIDLREGARRQHRTVSLFAVVQCWVQGLDGVAFQRQSLERLLGLNRFKATRVAWLKEDLEEFFPHQEIYWSSSTESSFHSLLVSRLPLQSFVPNGSMTTEERIKGMSTDGPKIALFKMWGMPGKKDLQNQFESVVPFYADAANFDERFLSSYLALLAQGQISPKNLPPLKAEDG